MKFSQFAPTILSAFVVVLTLAGCAPPESESKIGVQNTDPFEDQIAEYIRLFPYQDTFNYAMRYTGGDPAKLNTWVPGGEPVLTRAGDDIVVRMNNDTYYNGAVVFLGNGPVVIASNAPTKDRFYSFQLMDDRNVNYRNFVRPDGEYTLYFGEKPEQIKGEAIEVPSELSILLVRVEVKDKDDREDVAAAKAVYDGLTITAEASSEHPPADWLGEFPQDVIDEANRRIDQMFAQSEFLDLVLRFGQEVGKDISYLEHAAATKGAWGAPDPSHSAYDTIFFDKNGEEMIGSKGSYAVTTEVPPVDGFWSITVYDAERGGYFHPNADDRYHYNGDTAVANDDGTFTFTFKQACQAVDGNCLEVPPGQFDVLVRYYLPRPEVIAGEWVFPRVEFIAD